MNGMLKSFVKQVAKGQRGFTLIEMIVVVGIIAVLAAVIVPNMGKFIGQGESGAKSAEIDAVQTAMHAMMADKAINAVDEWDKTAPSSATQTWDALPTGTDTAFLEDYLQSKTTKFFYCYDNEGGITEQFETAETCTL